MNPKEAAKLLGISSRMTKFGDAPVIREGDIVDPAECTWECDCDKCQAKYKRWKEAFDAKQKQHEEKNT